MSLLEVADVTVRFGSLTAVDHVSMRLERGGVLGLVGGSGSGKSTLARVIVGLQRPTAGSVRLDASAAITSKGDRKARARTVQMVFQDPYRSLNPRMTIGEMLEEALRLRSGDGPADSERDRLLDLVHLDPAVADSYPHALSGGMRQRAAIARALAVEPRLLVADEITASLDASVQGAVLNLLRELRSELGLALLFISHNLATVRYISDEIAVMHNGRIVEIGAIDKIIDDPQNEYTRRLLDAVPPPIERAAAAIMRSRPSARAAESTGPAAEMSIDAIRTSKEAN